MIASIYFLLSIYVGILLVRRAFRLEGVSLAAFGALAGMTVTAWATLAIGLAAAKCGSENPVTIAAWGCLILLGLVSAAGARQLRGTLRALQQDDRWGYTLAALSFGIGVLLMWKTFRYHSSIDTFALARYVHSDFGSHIPLLRSFSMGENLPPQAPLMAAERIRYHFLLYFFVGVLERLGWDIDTALNVPSAIGFGAMLLAVRHLMATLFGAAKRNNEAAVAMALSLAAGSMTAFQARTWTEAHGWLGWLSNLFWRQDFSSGGPYFNWDQTITGLFWTLTIFTNQRHFAFGIAAGLFLLAFALQNAERQPEDPPAINPLYIGLGIGLLPFLHSLVFLSVAMVAGTYLLLARRRARLFVTLLVAAAVAYPQVRFLSSTNPDAAMSWHVGYAIYPKPGLGRFLLYWFENLGFRLALVPMFLIVLPTKSWKLCVASLPLFIIPNLVKFGPDLYTNHKFFNIWILILNIFVAVALVRLWRTSWRWRWSVVPAFVLLTASGIMDIPPILRDSMYEIRDWPTSATGKFFAEEASPRDAIATSYGVFHPAMVAGRRVLLGWPYFLWSGGYDDKSRIKLVREIFETKDMRRRCELMKSMGARYISPGVKTDRSEPYKPDLVYFDRELDLVAKDDLYLVYDVKRTCDTLKAKHDG